MIINKYKFCILIFSFFCCLYCLPKQLFSASLPLSFECESLIRLPSSSRYIKNTLSDLPDNIIVLIPNTNRDDDSFIYLDGHKVKLYPGASFKISNASFIPLVGRFEFASDKNASSSISIIANNCNAGYSYGHFLIEVTPDNGVFFAMKNNGKAWVKDIYRKVFEMRQGQQIHIPIYGQSILKNRVEAFWGKTPSSFGNLGEAGQESAYGVVGKDYNSNILKSNNNNDDYIQEKTDKENDFIDDEDVGENIDSE